MDYECERANLTRTVLTKAMRMTREQLGGIPLNEIALIISVALSKEEIESLITELYRITQ